jgi:dihydroxyacetone kinase
LRTPGCTTARHADLFQRKDDALGMGHGSPGEAGACTPGYHRDTKAMADAQHVAHLLFGLRQANRQR